MFTSPMMDASMLRDSSLSSHRKAGRTIIVSWAAVQTKWQIVTPNLWHSFSILPFSVHFFHILPPLSPFLSWSTTLLILTLPWLETARFPLNHREPAVCPGFLCLARPIETDRAYKLYCFLQVLFLIYQSKLHLLKTSVTYIMDNPLPLFADKL